MSFRRFSPDSAEFFNWGEGSGSALISRLVGPQESDTMGAYYGRFNGRRVAHTVHYDEFIVCLEGVFRLHAEGEVHVLHPCELLWLPKGTALEYDGEDALVFMSMAPVNWRDLE